MAPKDRQKFPPSLVLVHGWLFPTARVQNDVLKLVDNHGSGIKSPHSLFQTFSVMDLLSINKIAAQ